MYLNDMRKIRSILQRHTRLGLIFSGRRTVWRKERHIIFINVRGANRRFVFRSGTISKVMGDDYEYTPQIVPVVDLTNVLEGADEIDNAFAATKSLSLDGDVSRNLANKIDAEVQLQNGLKSAGNEDTLRAINALAGHMDGVAESIKGMSVTINGRKAIGYIDDRMGRLTAAKVK